MVFFTFIIFLNTGNITFKNEFHLGLKREIRVCVCIYMLVYD